MYYFLRPSNLLWVILYKNEKKTLRNERIQSRNTNTTKGKKKKRKKKYIFGPEV